MKIGRKIKIIFAVVIVVIIGVACLMFFNSKYYYDTNWIVGKHYTQIIERYGTFYRNFEGTYDPSSGEMILPGTYYYMVKPERKGYLDKRHAEYIVIHFNEDGIAEESYERYGWYGG